MHFINKNALFNIFSYHVIKQTNYVMSSPPRRPAGVFCLLVRKQKMYRDQLLTVLDTFLYIPIVIYKNTRTDLSSLLTVKYIRLLLKY
jgi:hypothetical protein